MSLGDIGLVGGLKSKSIANMVIYGTEFTATANVGDQFQKLAGGNQAVNDNRHSDVMPYSGKFMEMRLFIHAGAWVGNIFLQKNNVDTVLGFTNAVGDNTLQKIKADVPFVAGDVFRYRMNRSAQVSFREFYTLLFGGLDVT